MLFAHLIGIVTGIRCIRNDIMQKIDYDGTDKTISYVIT